MATIAIAPNNINSLNLLRNTSMLSGRDRFLVTELFGNTSGVQSEVLYLSVYLDV